NVPLSFVLDRGQHAQLSQMEELTGSVIQSDKPVGLMGGHNCHTVPDDVGACDHAEQMIPPIRALEHEYVGVMHRPRKHEPAVWRIVGAVDDTQLSWSSDVGGPTVLGAGQDQFFMTKDPFVVKSQDADHPFLLFTLMGGCYWPLLTEGAPGFGDGDPDF